MPSYCSSSSQTWGESICPAAISQAPSAVPTVVASAWAFSCRFCTDSCSRWMISCSASGLVNASGGISISIPGHQESSARAALIIWAICSSVEASSSKAPFPINSWRSCSILFLAPDMASTAAVIAPSDCSSMPPSCRIPTSVPRDSPHVAMYSVYLAV